MPLILLVAGTLFWENSFYLEDKKVEKKRKLEAEEDERLHGDVKQEKIK